MNGFHPFDEDNIRLFLDGNIGLPSRTIYVGSHEYIGKDDEESGVDFKMTSHVLKSLHVLNALGEEPIKMILNTTGGDEYEGLAIYDAIKTSKAPVDVYVFGSAMSMGSVMLQAARRRYLGPHSTVMVHMGDLSTVLDQRDIEANTKEWQRINSLVNDIYLERMREKNQRYSVNQLKELLSTDRYLSPTQAIELGLADEVIK
jgi:ATP-dependent Clp protease protease subunit